MFLIKETKIKILENIIRFVFDSAVESVQRKIQTERCLTYVKMALDIGRLLVLVMYAVENGENIQTCEL